jgi:hypothetical protein
VSELRSPGAWMIRAYVIGLATGTQAFTGGVGGAIFGTGVLAADLAKGAGWAINLTVAEWAIRRPAARRPPEGRRDHWVRYDPLRPADGRDTS